MYPLASAAILDVVPTPIPVTVTLHVVVLPLVKVHVEELGTVAIFGAVDVTVTTKPLTAIEPVNVTATVPNVPAPLLSKFIGVTTTLSVPGVTNVPVVKLAEFAVA